MTLDSLVVPWLEVMALTTDESVHRPRLALVLGLSAGVMSCFWSYVVVALGQLAFSTPCLVGVVVVLRPRLLYSLLGE